MQSNGNRSALQQYEQVSERGRVHDATPHELVQMMLDGALARLAAARGAMQAGETAKKAELVGRVIDLVDAGLRASLDLTRGGELAANLDALYDYMTRRLVEANLRNDAAVLDEVASLLRELQSGWRAIATTMDQRPGGEPGGA